METEKELHEKVAMLEATVEQLTRHYNNTLSILTRELRAHGSAIIDFGQFKINQASATKPTK